MGGLTADLVKNLTQPGRYGDSAGLYLVVAPTGSRSWTLRVQKDGKRTDKGLGGYPTVTLAVARTLTEDLRVAVRQGRATSKKARKLTAARAADTRGLTFREAAIQCRDTLSPRWRAPKAVVQWEQSMSKHVYPVIGDLQVAKVVPADVRGVLQPIWTASPAIARKVKQRLKTVFDWAVDMEHRESNPVGAFRFALPPQPALMSCIRSSSHKSEASQKGRKTDSCLPWSNKSASLAFSYPNELRIHHTSQRAPAVDPLSGRTRGAPPPEATQGYVRPPPVEGHGTLP